MEGGLLSIERLPVPDLDLVTLAMTFQSVWLHKPHFNSGGQLRDRRKFLDHPGTSANI